MNSVILSAFALLCLVQIIHGQNEVHHRRVTSQMVTRIHKFHELKPPAVPDDRDIRIVREPIPTGRQEGGYSFEGDFGVNRRRRCNRGMIDKTATAIRDNVHAGVGDMVRAISGAEDKQNRGRGLGLIGGVLGGIGKAAGHLVEGVVDQGAYMINDAACGLGNIANEAANMVKTGDIVGGVGKMANEFVGGVANMAQDFGSEGVKHIGLAANDLGRGVLG